MDLLLRVWDVYPWAVDLCLYFFLFAAAARVSFAKIYPGHEGRMLAAAIGIVLAAGLTIAQRKIGFSLESLGPIAAVLLCVIVFIVAHRLLSHSELPPWVRISFSIFFALGLIRIALPDYTSRLIRDNPGLVLFALAALAFWMWQSASQGSEFFRRRLPGFALERFKMVPESQTLRKEHRVANKRLRHETAENVKETKKVGSGLSAAIHLLESGGFSPKTTPKIVKLLEAARAQTKRLESRCDSVRQVDEALQRFDWKWFQRMRNVHLGQLTPAQQDILKRSALEERRRLNVESVLKEMETDAGHRLRALEQHLDKAVESIRASNAAAALGWLREAKTEEEHLLQIEEKVLDLERRLIRLVSRQTSEQLHQ